MVDMTRISEKTSEGPLLPRPEQGPISRNLREMVDKSFMSNQALGGCHEARVLTLVCCPGDRLLTP